MLEVRNLSRSGTAQDPDATVLEDISFDLRRGEILGLAGLVGAGRTELARTIFGADKRESGEILIDGTPCPSTRPRTPLRLGLGLLPEDRKEQGLILSMAVRQNMSLVDLDEFTRFGFVQRRKRNADGHGLRAPLRDPHARHRPARRQPERRQPAEGRHLQVADGQAQDPDHGRADPRHRRRRQVGHLRPHAPTGGRRHQHHHDLVGVPGAARHVRPHRLPHRRDASRPSCRGKKRRWRRSCTTARCATTPSS